MFLAYQAFHFSKGSYMEGQIFDVPHYDSKQPLQTIGADLNLVKKEGFIQQDTPTIKTMKPYMQTYVEQEIYQAGFLRDQYYFEKEFRRYCIMIDEEGKLKPNIVTTLWIDKSVFNLKNDFVVEIEGNFIITCVEEVLEQDFYEDGTPIPDTEYYAENFAPLTNDDVTFWFDMIEQEKVKIMPTRLHHPDYYDFSNSIKVIPFKTFDELDEMMDNLKNGNGIKF